MMGFAVEDIMLSRRDFGLGGATALALTSASSAASAPPAARGAATDPLDGVELYRHVLDYCGFGEHRSGSVVDDRTSQWIFDRMRAAGFATKFDTERFRFFDLKACSVTVGSETVRAYPEWFPTATGPVPVTAPLALLPAGASYDTLKGKVWLTFSENGTPDKGGIEPATRRAVGAAGKAGAVAAIVVVRSLSGALVGRNAVDIVQSQTPWCSIPFVGVGGRDEAMLVAAAKQGAPAAVLLYGDDVPDRIGRNVVGRIGSGRDLIVVTTPHSGMFRCGGERAAGVALFLGMVDWLGRRKPNARYLFCSTYGHEIKGRGVTLFERTTLPPKEQVKCWLHFGSGSGVWRFERGDGGLKRSSVHGGTGNFLASERFLPIIQRSFANIPDIQPTPRKTGDLAPFLERGYVGFGPSGSNIFTHTEADGPEQTAPELLGPLAHDFAAALELIETM